MIVRKACAVLGGVVLVVPLVAWTVAHAKERREELGAYKLYVDTIKVPGDLTGGFDISWADPEAGRYYLADRGAVSIDVIDTKHNTFLYAIPLHAAGNGVVAIRKSNDDEDEVEGAGELWVGDARSFGECFVLRTKSVVAESNSFGNARADELAYDPLQHHLLNPNDRDTPSPFV